jgi:DNA-binding GntR family transcriptional regulator
VSKILTSEHVYTRIKDLILSQELKYGQPINETELTNLLGVSRTPVREALKKLEAKKLVEIIPHRGAIVLGINVKDIEEIFVIRQSLEGTCGFLAAKLISDANLDIIEEQLTEADNYCASGLFSEAAKAGKYIHELIMSIVDNERIIEILSDFNESLIYLDKIAINIDGRVLRSNQEHRMIFEALKRRDSDDVRKCIEKHIQSTKEDLIICFKNSKITSA